MRILESQVGCICDSQNLGCIDRCEGCFGIVRTLSASIDKKLLCFPVAENWS